MTLNTFKYSAVSVTGKAAHGTIDAIDVEHANAMLLRQGLYPFRLSAPENSAAGPAQSFRFGSSSNRRMKQREEFYRKSAVLLGAGIGIDRVMRILVDTKGEINKCGLAVAIEKEISSGRSFSAAVQTAMPEATAVELAAIQVSEKTGQLANTLSALAKQLETQSELRAKLASMLVYPLFLMALVPVVLIFVAAILVPNIAPLFENSGKPMPLLLAIFVEVSAMVEDNPFTVLVAAIIACVGITMLSRTAAFKKGLHRLVFASPIFSELQRQKKQQSFSQSMGTLLANGSTLQDALAAIAVGQRYAGLTQVQKDVSEGLKLSKSLMKNEILDLETSHLIAIGEEGNQLHSMFFHIAGTAQKNYTARLERLMTLLVPILTLLIGLVVGGVMVSVMTALLAVNEVPLQ
jgi:general secretion pathway protein F